MKRNWKENLDQDVSSLIFNDYIHLKYKICLFVVTHRLEFRSAQGIPSESTHRSARPTSLYPLRPNDSGIIGHDVLQPEREPIRFDVALVGAPPEVEQLVNNIKQVAEQFLYHWKTFPISKYSNFSVRNLNLIRNFVY